MSLRFLLLLPACLACTSSASQAGLVAYWPFNDAGTFRTDAASGNTLTAGGAAAFAAAGKSGGGLALNGTNSYLGGTVANLPVGNSSYSVAAWFKPAALGPRGIVGWGNYGFARQVNALRLYDSGNGFRHYWWSADLDATNLPTNFTNGNWHHVAATYDGLTRRLYLNGVQIISDSPGANNSSANNFRIGSTNNAEYFSGTLDDIAIYSNAISAAEVQSLASGASPLKGPLITSFTTDKPTAWEGESVQLSWAVNTAYVTGEYSYEITRGAAVLNSGTTASGSFSTTVPDLAGAAQTVSFTVRAIETGGSNIISTASASVSADPGKPSAAGQSGLTTPADTPLAITLAGSDPNGGSLSYSIVAQPAHGAVTGNGPGVTYTPAAGVYGADQFTFKVSDGKYESAPAIVRLSVMAPPPSPLPPSSVSIDDTSVNTEAVAGSFQANISSPDPNPGEAHTFTLVSGPGSEENGNFTISGHQLRTAIAFAGKAGQVQRIRIRSTDAGGLSIEAPFVLTVVEKQRGLGINEVHYNGVVNTVRNSFIEIYNNGSTEVNLTGWRISGGVDYRFPAGTMMAPDTYLIVAEDPATIQSAFSKTALGPWDNAIVNYPDGAKETNGLGNDGAIVRLRNAADQVVSEVDYQPRSPWPALANGEGSSMELIHPDLDKSHGSNWTSSRTVKAVTDLASPGAKNVRYATANAPAVRQVAHSPQTPLSADSIIVTARITDPDGVASAALTYQICAPGSFVPSTLPKAISGGVFVNVATPLAANPAFEDAANWTTVAMNDDGLGDDAVSGDSIWTGSIPPQPHRTLVRYRISAADNAGNSARLPYPGDPSLNFACFVYDGVPDYQGTPSATLTSLPTYHFLTRKADFEQCIAYNASFRLNGSAPSWTFENWEAAFVYDGIVYDHVPYRLHGANGRYTASGTGGAGTSKRSFRFFFNKGYPVEARGNDGQKYPTPWSSMITENCWENRATYTFSLNEMVNFYIWNALGVPSPLGNWAHFRTVMQTAEQPDQWRGDFWGLMYVHEDYDKNFLDAHNLPKGNLYKLTRDPVTGTQQQRYQAAFGPVNGSDHDELNSSLRGTSTPAYITGRVNLDLWCRYHAYAEAIRHYDYWPTGDNNAAWYFYPNYSAANNNKGVMWWLPNDVDATWGPTWNNGHDLVHNSLFNDAASTGGDALTNPTLWPVYFNQVREIRRLLWQQDQINPLIDQFAEVIRPFVNADFARWYNAPADAGNFGGLGGFGMSSSVGQTSLSAYVGGMKDFAFDPDNNGSTWPGANVGAGGRAAWLDQLGNSLGENATKYPATPVITYTGGVSFPVNDLRFSTSDFSDPQGADTFSAIQWRMAQVNDSAVFTPGVPRLLEINASYDSGAIATFATQFKYTPAACEPGKRYRARVRMKDATGRWSYWSNAVEFIAGSVDIAALSSALVVSEVMYHATSPTPGEQAAAAALAPPQVWNDDDFDYVEIRNVSGSPVDLSGLAFTQGFDFAFQPGLTLAPGATILIVDNLAAFTQRYGAGKPVAGAWDANDKLSNGGDTLTLQFGQIEPPVFSFSYDDEPSLNWPAAADGNGPSIVRIDPEDTSRNPGLGINWRASLAPGGTPGGDDRQSFTDWMTANGQVSAQPDAENDGLVLLLEYALGGNPSQDSSSLLPSGGIAALTVAGVPGVYATLSFRRSNSAEDLTQFAEFSADLGAWNLPGVQVSSQDNGDGTRTEVWRSPAAVGAEQKFFGRLRFTTP